MSNTRKCYAERALILRADDGRISAFIGTEKPQAIFANFNNQFDDIEELAKEAYPDGAFLICNTCKKEELIGTEGCVIALLRGWPTCCGNETRLKYRDSRKDNQ